MQAALTDGQFIERIGESSSQNLLHMVRALRTSLAQFSPTSGIDPQTILPTHRIESDLDVHHLDSLDLVDFATSLEIDGMRLESDDLQKIAELNGQDGTVQELALILINASRQPN